MTTIEILEWMIKEYEKRGGGYSQIEALKEAISALSKPSVPSEYANGYADGCANVGVPSVKKIAEVLCKCDKTRGQDALHRQQAQAIHNLITGKEKG